MGRIITLEEAQALPAGQLRDWCYNALDCTGTREVFDVLRPRLTEAQARTYAFERGLQAPALSMMMRGVRIDKFKRDAMVATLKRELKKDVRLIGKLPVITEHWNETELETGWCPAQPDKHHKWPRSKKGEPPIPEADKKCERCGAQRVKAKPFNANSDDQRAHLFYDILQLKPEHNKKHKVTTDGDALERIGKKNPYLKTLTDAIAQVVDKKKQLGSLSAPLTPDGRYPSTFNVGAAWTGRQSSNKNPYKLGGNLQNVAPRHRRAFISDPGMELLYPDYMQGESNIVAHLSGDEKYLEAHRLGDVHTYVARLVWPELPWTGDLKKDKKIAKQNPPWDQAEGHSYRFHSKGVQHGGNYGRTAVAISMALQIPLRQARLAYERYFTEFDGIPAWQSWVHGEIAEGHALVNPLGRTWIPFGRPWDQHTKNQGLAFLPQSLLADINNIAMWLVWYYLEDKGLVLMAQVHDALLGQYPLDRIDLVREALKLMSIPVPVTDIHGKTRMMDIGVEAAVGRNWGHKLEDNPYGLDEAPIEAYLKEHPL